jgi:hypothetical protein
VEGATGSASATVFAPPPSACTLSAEVLVRSRLSFQLGETMGWATLEPLVDGRPLSQLAEAFERERGLGKPGGYGGFCVEELAPSGQACFPPAEQDPSRTMVLACGCTVPGCWPLTCRVEVGPDEVVWHDFSNPHVDGSPAEPS